MLPWQGIVMPAGTPKPIVDKLNQEVTAVLQSAVMKQRYQESGLDFYPMSSEQFGQLMAKDYVKYGKIIKAANIKVD